MERLILDAEKLDSSFVATRDANGDLAMSYADIVDAIHIVQTEMGIMGTTAKEASETISGSLASLKSAWSNLVVGFATNDADLDGLITNVVDSAETAFNNLAPAFEKALTGISTGVEKIAPIIAGKLPGIINKLLPSITSTAAKAVQSFVKGIAQNVKSITKSALQVVKTLSNAIITNLPEIVRAGLEIIIELAKGIAESLPELVPTIVDVILEIVDVLTDPANLGSLVDGAIAIITGLADGLIQALPHLIERLPEIVENIATGIAENAPKLLEAAIALIEKFAEYLNDPANWGSLAVAAGGIIGAVTTGLLDLSGGLVSVGAELLADLVEGLTGIEGTGDILRAGGKAYNEFVRGLKENIDAHFADTVNSALDAAADEIGKGGGAFRAGGAFIFEFARGMYESMPELWAVLETIASVLSPGLATAMNQFEGVFVQATKKKIQEEGDNLVSSATGALRLVEENTQSVADNLTAVMEAGGESAVSAYVDAIAAGVDPATAAAEAIANAVSGALDISGNGEDIGQNLVASLAKGMLGRIGDVASAAGEVAAAAINQLKNVMQIRSPSKVTRRFGEYFSKGFSLGILDELGSIYDSANSAAETAIDALNGYNYDLEFSPNDSIAGKSAGTQSSEQRQIIALLSEIKEKIGGDVVLDSGALVGYVDSALGQLSVNKTRGGAVA